MSLKLDDASLRDYDKHFVRFRRTETDWETSAIRNYSNNPQTNVYNMTVLLPYQFRPIRRVWSFQLHVNVDV